MKKLKLIIIFISFFCLSSDLHKDLDIINRKITVSDQMFEPVNPRYPEQMYHLLEKNTSYIVKNIFIENKVKKLTIIEKDKEIERTISLESIHYPKHLLFSNKKCFIHIDSLENNMRYIFFRKEKEYEYKEKRNEYLVLDEKRNQVSLTKNQIVIK